MVEEVIERENPSAHDSLLGFEIFVSGIFVAVDLHVGNVPLLGGHGLVNFNETLQSMGNE